MSDQSSASSNPASSASKRGILYLKWGLNDSVLQRSINSVRAVHPELPIHIHLLPDNATLLDKAAMMNFTPFEETLYLDVDTIVLNRLDFGFEMANRHGLACSICECPSAHRYSGIKGDLVEFNTGVLFFTKKSKTIFDSWNAKVRTIDSSIRFYDEQNQIQVSPYNDQAAFALAVAEGPSLPFILPLNWNFRPIWNRGWFGPIMIWHGYSNPTQEIANFNKQQSQPGSIVQFVQLNP